MKLLSASQVLKMLTVYLHDSPESLRFRLVGDFAETAAIEFAQSWKTGASIRLGRRLVIDLANVGRVDETGRRVLQQL